MEAFLGPDTGTSLLRITHPMTIDSGFRRYTMRRAVGGSGHGGGRRGDEQTCPCGQADAGGQDAGAGGQIVGVARQTAYTWKARLDEGGIDALRAMAPGRPAQLDNGQLDALAQRCCKAPSATASAPSCGHSSACAPSSSGCTACASAKCTSGGCSGPWALARRSPSAAPSSATSRRAGSGSARPGRRLKKVCRRAPADRLHRRVGTVRAADPRARVIGRPQPDQLRA